MEWHFQVVTISTTLSLIIPNCCRVEQVCSPWQRDIRSTNVYSERSFTNLWATEQPLSSSSFSVFRRAAVDKFTRRPDRMSLSTWFYCCAELMKLSVTHAHRLQPKEVDWIQACTSITGTGIFTMAFLVICRLPVDYLFPPLNIL